LGSSKIGDEIIGDVKIQKVTNTLVFMNCELRSKKNKIAIASGVWKKLNKKL
jgi:hypothetical protein